MTNGVRNKLTPFYLKFFAARTITKWEYQAIKLADHTHISTTTDAYRQRTPHTCAPTCPGSAFSPNSKSRHNCIVIQRASRGRIIGQHQRSVDKKFQGKGLGLILKASDPFK